MELLLNLTKQREFILFEHESFRVFAFPFTNFDRVCSGGKFVQVHPHVLLALSLDLHFAYRLSLQVLDLDVDRSIFIIFKLKLNVCLVQDRLSSPEWMSFRFEIPPHPQPPSLYASPRPPFQCHRHYLIKPPLERRSPHLHPVRWNE